MYRRKDGTPPLSAPLSLSLSLSVWLLVAVLVALPRGALANGTHWEVTWPSSGSVHLPSPPSVFSDIDWSEDPWGYLPLDVFADGTYTVSTSGTTTVTATWCDANHNPDPGNAPAFVVLKITSVASVSVTEGDPAPTSETSSVDNGLGWPASSVTHENGTYKNEQAGSRVVRVASSNGVATYAVSTSASVTCTIGPNTWARLSVYAGTSAAVDDRRAVIGSSIDPTYYCGGAPNHDRLAAVQDADSTTHAHSAKLTGNNTLAIDFWGYWPGSWAQGSKYHWYSQAKDYALSGYFNPCDIGTLTNTYTASDSSAGDERIHLRLTDSRSSDPTTCETQYFITWEDRVQHWNRDGDTVFHPLPHTITSEKDNGEWTKYSWESNSKDTPQEVIVTVTMTTGWSATNTGTIGGSLTMSAADIQLAFQTNESISIGTTYQCATSYTHPFTVGVGKTGFFYWGKPVEERNGHCCPFGPSGFAGRSPWQAMVPGVGPGNTAAIAWNYYEKPI